MCDMPFANMQGLITMSEFDLVNSSNLNNGYSLSINQLKHVSLTYLIYLELKITKWITHFLHNICASIKNCKMLIKLDAHLLK